MVWDFFHFSLVLFGREFLPPLNLGCLSSFLKQICSLFFCCSFWLVSNSSPYLVSFFIFQSVGSELNTVSVFDKLRVLLKVVFNIVVASSWLSISFFSFLQGC